MEKVIINDGLHNEFAYSLSEAEEGRPQFFFLWFDNDIFPLTASDAANLCNQYHMKSTILIKKCDDFMISIYNVDITHGIDLWHNHILHRVNMTEHQVDQFVNAMREFVIANI